MTRDSSSGQADLSISFSSGHSHRQSFALFISPRGRAEQYLEHSGDLTMPGAELQPSFPDTFPLALRCSALLPDFRQRFFKWPSTTKQPTWRTPRRDWRPAPSTEKTEEEITNRPVQVGAIIDMFKNIVVGMEQITAMPSKSGLLWRPRRGGSNEPMLGASFASPLDSFIYLVVTVCAWSVGGPSSMTDA